MTKLVYKQNLQRNYKIRQRVTLSYTLSCFLISRLFPGLLHFFENKRYCISNRSVFNGTNMVSKIHQKHLGCYPNGTDEIY